MRLFASAIFRGWLSGHNLLEWEEAQALLLVRIYDHRDFLWDEVLPLVCPRGTKSRLTMAARLRDTIENAV